MSRLIDLGLYKGADGKDATINGQNVIELLEGEHITLTPGENTLTIGTHGLKEHLADYNNPHRVSVDQLGLTGNEGQYLGFNNQHKPTPKDIDSALSSTSVNPVQNKVVNTAIEEIDGRLDLHDTVIGAINQRLANHEETLSDHTTNIRTLQNTKQNKLSGASTQYVGFESNIAVAKDIEDSFIPDSTNPVQSKVIQTALSGIDTSIQNINESIQDLDDRKQDKLSGGNDTKYFGFNNDGTGTVKPIEDELKDTNNPVQSRVLKAALDGIGSAIDTINDAIDDLGDTKQDKHIGGEEGNVLVVDGNGDISTADVHDITVTFNGPNQTSLLDPATVDIIHGHRYVITPPQIPGYIPSVNVIKGQATGDGASHAINYTKKQATVTITYQGPVGFPTLSPHIETLDVGSAYSIASPTIPGYTPSMATVSGTVPDTGISHVVIYEAKTVEVTISYKLGERPTSAGHWGLLKTGNLNEEVSQEGDQIGRLAWRIPAGTSYHDILFPKDPNKSIYHIATKDPNYYAQFPADITIHAKVGEEITFTAEIIWIQDSTFTFVWKAAPIKIVVGTDDTQTAYCYYNDFEYWRGIG